MKPTLLGAVAAVVALAAAGLLASPFQVVLLTRGFVWAMLGLAAWFLLRVAGRSSLGTSAFFGSGAYATGLAATRWHHENFWVVLGLAVGASVVVGVVVGLVAGRLSGIHFLLITLAFAEMLRALTTRWRTLGGDDGISGITRPKSGLLGLDLRPAENLMWFTGGWLLVLSVLLVVILRSPFGAALIGVRDSESRMATLGYASTPYRVAAVAVAALIAGVAGCLHAYVTRFVSPAEFAPLVSAKALLFAVVGGVGLVGAALAGVVLTFVEDALSTRFDRWLLLLGVLYIGIAMIPPGPLSRIRRVVGGAVRGSRPAGVEPRDDARPAQSAPQATPRSADHAAEVPS